MRRRRESAPHEPEVQVPAFVSVDEVAGHEINTNAPMDQVVAAVLQLVT